MSERLSELIPVYCETMPEVKEPGKLYISKMYEIAIHLCACGCGDETVTPLGANEWTLTEQADKVTLRPSIGNWAGQSPYHAHYYITDNQIQWL